MNVKVYLLSISSLLLIVNCRGAPKNDGKRQQVCVIGAGVAGLASVKQLADHADEFDIVVFEQKSDVGGLWMYTDNVDKDEHGLPVQSMYKNMRTNLPKEIMTFPDYRDFYGEERSCVTHETFLEYLRNYTDHFQLRRYIQFDTLVEKVTPILGSGDWQTTKWEIRTRNLNSNVSEFTTCDAVEVCNGRNTKPRIPKISGIETFPGKVIHSHNYRKPEYYTGKTVVLLGAGSSGVDISIELSHFAEKVYLSHNHDKITTLPSNIIQVAGVVSANGSELILKDGTKIIADEFMFCTGYLFDYPFLDERSKIIVHNKRVEHLYKNFINIEHPSMRIATYSYSGPGATIYHTQAAYFVALLRGKIRLPNKKEMMDDAKLQDKYQTLFPEDATWNYFDDLLQQAGSEPLPPFYKKAFQIWREYAQNDMYHFKENNLRVSDDGNITLILSHGF